MEGVNIKRGSTVLHLVLTWSAITIKNIPCLTLVQPEPDPTKKENAPLLVVTNPGTPSKSRLYIDKAWITNSCHITVMYYVYTYWE